MKFDMNRSRFDINTRPCHFAILLNREWDCMLTFCHQLSMKICPETKKMTRVYTAFVGESMTVIVVLLDLIWPRNNCLRFIHCILTGNVSTFSLIFNEHFVKFKNRLQKWTPRPRKHTHTKTQFDWMMFDIKMTGCQLFMNN